MGGQINRLERLVEQLVEQGHPQRPDQPLCKPIVCTRVLTAVEIANAGSSQPPAVHYARNDNLILEWPARSDASEDSTGKSVNEQSDPDPIQEAALSAPMDRLFQQSLLGRKAAHSVDSVSQPALSPTYLLGNQHRLNRFSSAFSTSSSDPVDLGLCTHAEGIRLFSW